MPSPSAVSRATPSAPALPANVAERGGRRPHPLQHDVEAGQGLRHADARLALAAEQRRERRLELRQAVGDAWDEHRAGGDVDQIVGAGAAIAERNALLGAAEGKGGPPTARQRHRPDRLDLRCKAPRLQGGGDLLAFPVEVSASLHVLESAAAAHPEIGADWRHAVRARLEHLEQHGAVLARLERDLDPLARQRERHIDRAAEALRHAVTAGAEPADLDLELHGLSLHGAHRSGIQHCRHGQGSANRSRRRPASPPLR